MNIFDFFRTDKNDIRRSHIKNLISVAMADGHLDQEEWDLVVYIATKLGMDESEIENIKANRNVVKFKIPSTYEEKVEQVNDLVAMMTIDGQVNNKELKLCKKIALNLDIHPRAIDDIVEDFYASQKVA